MEELITELRSALNFFRLESENCTKREAAINRAFKNESAIKQNLEQLFRNKVWVYFLAYCYSC